MSSADIERVIRAYLEAAGGEAVAGDVITAAEEAGFRPSTTRKHANSVVEKLRNGNEFRWRLRQAPGEVNGRDYLESRAESLRIAFEAETTDAELEALIDDRDSATSESEVARRTAAEQRQTRVAVGLAFPGVGMPIAVPGSPEFGFHGRPW